MRSLRRERPIGTALAYRKDLFDQAGVQMDNAPKNADDFKRILQQLTRPDQNQWGIAGWGNLHVWLEQRQRVSGHFPYPQQLEAGPQRQADQRL